MRRRSPWQGCQGHPERPLLRPHPRELLLFIAGGVPVVLVPELIEILGGVVVDVELWGITQSQDALQRTPQDPTGILSALSSHLCGMLLHKFDFLKGTECLGKYDT